MKMNYIEKMIIQCPSCMQKFNLAQDALGESGKKVRCTKCSHVWHASAPQATVLSFQKSTAAAIPEDSEDLVDKISPSTQGFPFLKVLILGSFVFLCLLLILKGPILQRTTKLDPFYKSLGYSVSRSSLLTTKSPYRQSIPSVKTG